MIKFTKLDLHDTFERIKNANIFWVIMATLMFVITIFTNSYRWWKLASLLDYKLSFFHAIRLYFESAFANNFLPSNLAGDALRAYELNALSTGITSWLKAASTVIMERIFGFAMMFLVMIFGLVALEFHPQINMPFTLKLALWLSFIATILGLLAYKLLLKLPFEFINKIKFAIQEYTKCKKSLLIIIFWTLITHLFLLLGNVCTSLAINNTYEHIPFWYWLIITPASTLISFVVPAVKGVGAKEASYVYFLGLLGVPSHDSLAIAFIAFIATLLCSLPGLSYVFRKLDLSRNLSHSG